MDQTTFFDNVIDERHPLEVLAPEVFDDFLSKGWRLLGQSMVRHNFSVCRGEICHTIPLRIRLDDFEPSKSQRQLLRRNAALVTAKRSAIRFSRQKLHLFDLHIPNVYKNANRLRWPRF